jgi:hypothetical protein
MAGLNKNDISDEGTASKTDIHGISPNECVLYN